MKKICNKCSEEKDTSDFYFKQGECKICTRKRVSERESVLRQSPEWVEKEKKRGRDKYYRLNYKDKYKPTQDKKRETMRKYNEKYPEKLLARRLTQRLSCKKGNELHHWSYKQEHRKDVIELSVLDHNKAHRYMVYDQERMMYRRYDTNELLDTKEAHIEFIESLKSKP